MKHDAGSINQAVHRGAAPELADFSVGQLDRVGEPVAPKGVTIKIGLDVAEWPSRPGNETRNPVSAKGF
jgi:hypothetical protein